MNPLPPPPPSTGGMPPPPLSGVGSPYAPGVYNLGYAPMPAAPFGARVGRPRPKSPTGSLLVMFGAVWYIVAAFMPWYDGDGYTLNGLDTFVQRFGTDDFKAPGALWIGFGTIVLGLGIACFFVGKQIALAIVTLIVTAIAVLISFIGVAVVKDQKDFDTIFHTPGTSGPGVAVGIIAILISLAGAIVMLAKRRA